MMTDEQRFLFDPEGFVVVAEVLDAATVARMAAVMDARGVAPPEEKSDDYRFGDFLRWGEDFRNGKGPARRGGSRTRPLLPVGEETRISLPYFLGRRRRARVP